MIRCYEVIGGRLSLIMEGKDATDGQAALPRAVWIDVTDPTEEEDRLINAAVSVDIPSRADMEEIETSSRLYTEDGKAFMTALLPVDTTSDSPRILPVSFVLAGGTLITVRYHEPRAFEAFTSRALRINTGCGDAISVLSQLLDAVVDRIADVLELVGQEVDGISKDVFRQADQSVRHHDFGAILKRIGRKGDLISIIRDSLATLDRLFTFLGNLAGQKGVDKDTRAQVKTLSRDARSLSDHAGFLSQKVTFLLDATLGMINIEQSGIIKIFSVAAVIFLPPTLVASIYGMNFEMMPELGWTLGYPLALGLMVVSAVIPYLFFKRKGWL